MTQRPLGRLLGLLGLLALTRALALTQNDLRGPEDARVRRWIDENCVRCHGAPRPKADLRLDELPLSFDRDELALRWRQVVERIAAGEMPPEDEPERPSLEEATWIVKTLSHAIEQGHGTGLADSQAACYRRLSREEYAWSIEDVLGVPVDTGWLLEDERYRGFERIGPRLATSVAHMERFARSAERVLSEALPDRIPETARIRLSALELAGGTGVFREPALASVRAAAADERLRVDLWPGQGLPIERAAGVSPGLYRLKLRLSGLRSIEGRPPYLVLGVAGCDTPLFATDVDAPEGAPCTIELEAWLGTNTSALVLTNASPGPSILARMNRGRREPFLSLAEGRLPWQVPLLSAQRVPLYPLLIVDSFELEGPAAPSAATAEWRPTSDTSDAWLQATLRRFAQRMFRRPLREHQLDAYARLLASERKAGASPLAALRSAMGAILCSPSFLFLREGDPEASTSELDAWELAARLSYFLSGSLPDERLRAAASDGSLLEPETLRDQTRRLLSDSRAERFAYSFVRQWLRLDRVGRFPPDKELYPEYDIELERAMIAETTSFFGEVLRTNASPSQLLDSSWVMLNERLARHYGIEGTFTDRFERVPLAAVARRGGLLTQASVLSATSDGTRQRPVHRGAWLAEVILGESVPPPPANIEPIGPDSGSAEKRTLRERIGAHATDPSCAICHARIDPLGFAFEHYDAIGRWREVDQLARGHGEAPVIDASGVLPDGRRFAGADELRRLLLDDLPQFRQTLLVALATYALRRPPGLEGRRALERIALESADPSAGVATLIESLVVSDLFRSR